MSPPGTENQNPPSPPLSDVQELHYGLHHVAQDNSASPYQPIPYAFENSTYMPPPPASNTSFSSPEQHEVMLGPYGQSPYHSAYHPQHDGRFGMHYNQYGTLAYYPHPNIAYHGYPLAQQSQYPVPPVVASSPPTPAASDQGGNGKRIRKSRSLVPSGSTRSARPEKQVVPRASNNRRGKNVSSKVAAEKNKVPQITAPLSELTKDLEHVPIKDMNAWVTRSEETRIAEVAVRHGYVTRPMNSFMLYRSAYAERTKIWCLQNNHQVVSSVSGESWPMEPPEIRDLYTEYARVERDNHAKAHPGYKFSPSKTENPSRKRKEPTVEVIEEEPSDLDELEYEWQPNADKSQINLKQTTLSAGNTSNLSQQEEYFYEGLNGRERSTFEWNNPGRPMPLPLGTHELQGQYYQTYVRPNIRDPAFVEDVVIRRTDTPIAQYAPAPPVIGLPGAHHYELLNQQPAVGSDTLTREPYLDPLLSEYDANYTNPPTDLTHDPTFPSFNQPELPLDDAPPIVDLPVDEYQAASNQYQLDLESWQFHNDPVGGDPVAEFDEWMEQTNNR